MHLLPSEEKLLVVGLLLLDLSRDRVDLDPLELQFVLLELFLEQLGGNDRSLDQLLLVLNHLSQFAFVA
jgi:hypothetical protein